MEMKTIERCGHQFPSSNNTFLRTKTTDLNKKQRKQAQFCIVKNFGIESQKCSERERGRKPDLCRKGSDLNCGGR